MVNDPIWGKSTRYAQPSIARGKALGRIAQLGRSSRESLFDVGLDLPVADCRLLANQVEAGEEARRELIEGNMLLAVRFGNQHARTYKSDPEDAVAEAVIGLITAADTYDPDRACFCTHAVWRIRHRLAYLIRSNSKRMMTSINLDLIDPIDHRTVEVDLDRESSRVASQARVDRMMAHLQPREAFIIARRHGLDGYNPATLDVIGHDMKLSKERVRQIETKAKAKLASVAHRYPLSLMQEFLA